MSEKAHSVFKTAQLYAQAAGHLNGVFPSMIIPSTVIAALSLELSFKALYLLEFQREFKVNSKPSHDFFQLFNELPQDTRNELVRAFDARIAIRDKSDLRIFEQEGVRVPLDLPSNLEQWSGVFTKLRYVHEFVEKSAGKRTYWVFFPEIHTVLTQANVRRGEASLAAAGRQASGKPS